MSEYLTVNDVANRLKVSNMTVYRLLQSKQLQAVQIGRAYRISEVSLKEYLEAQST